MRKKEPNIVVIGGGTGSFALLSGLKNHTPNITALVNMADDGGSTGVLIDELGVLPPGDVRQCLVALSDAPEEVRELFNFRFPRGTLRGHSFGNLFISAVEKMKNGDFNEAVRMAGDVLRITGRVMPITLDSCQLIAEVGKKKYKGQRRVTLANIPTDTEPRLYLKKPAQLNPEAEAALNAADMVVIAPGGLYGSLAPAMLVEGVRATLQYSRAKIVYVCNLVNKPHQTAGFAVHDYVREIHRIAGTQLIGYVLYNTDAPTKAALKRYALDGEFPVAVDKKALKHASYEAIGGAFLSHAHHKRNPNDKFIKRSLIRHDGEAVAEALLKLL